MGGPICWICSQLSGWLTGGWGSGSVRALVQRVAYETGVLSRSLQVEPHLGFLGCFMGHYFFLLGWQSAALWLQNPNLEGLWARSVRTEV